MKKEREKRRDSPLVVPNPPIGAVTLRSRPTRLPSVFQEDLAPTSPCLFFSAVLFAFLSVVVPSAEIPSTLRTDLTWNFHRTAKMALQSSSAHWLLIHLYSTRVSKKPVLRHIHHSPQKGTVAVFLPIILKSPRLGICLICSQNSDILYCRAHTHTKELCC